jgi:hypothetical protein
MKKDERGIVEVLKSELEFIESGGYSRSPGESWRPPFIFEDSPSCANFGCREKQVACEDCVLAQLASPNLRSAKHLCRNIPLNLTGDTLDSLYRCADEQEIETTVVNWLKAKIATLEAVRVGAAAEPPADLPQESEIPHGIGLHNSAPPKCANPARPTEFH